LENSSNFFNLDFSLGKENETMQTHLLGIESLKVDDFKNHHTIAS
jgi:hypothetical protein